MAAAYPSTPEGVVEALVQAGFDAKSITGLSNYGDVRERAGYFAEDYYNPGYDCNDIVLGFKILKEAQDADTAKIAVVYEKLGSICAEELDLLPKVEQNRVVYHLERRKGFWRIVAPYDPPSISIQTAIKMSERLMDDYPERKATIMRNIEVLKRILRQEGAVLENSGGMAEDTARAAAYESSITGPSPRTEYPCCACTPRMKKTTSLPKSVRLFNE